MSWTHGQSQAVVGSGEDAFLLYLLASTGPDLLEPYRRVSSDTALTVVLNKETTVGIGGCMAEDCGTGRSESNCGPDRLAVAIEQPFPVLKGIGFAGLGHRRRSPSSSEAEE